ncbi:MAG: TfoX/Sxy family protein [bacterium]|nr:TfoX/Sxy family protein [bacterium]
MATTADFAQYVREQLAEAGTISLRRMFGDYGVYLNGKFVGLICDNQLFIKETTAGRALLPDVLEGLPYDGAKTPYFIIDDLEDTTFLGEFLRASDPEIPWQKRKPRN